MNRDRAFRVADRRQAGSAGWACREAQTMTRRDSKDRNAPPQSAR